MDTIVGLTYLTTVQGPVQKMVSLVETPGFEAGVKSQTVDPGIISFLSWWYWLRCRRTARCRFCLT